MPRIPPADRAAIQFDLTWAGDYSGPIDGEFSERLVAAVKAYQKRHKNPVTGVMSRGGAQGARRRPSSRASRRSAGGSPRTR